MVHWGSFNATMNRTKHISHVNNTVASTALNIYFLWNLPLPTFVGISTPQSIFPNLLLMVRWKKCIFNHISSINTVSNTALTRITEAQKGLKLIWRHHLTEGEKKNPHILSPLQPRLRRKGCIWSSDREIKTWEVHTPFFWCLLCFIYGLLVWILLCLIYFACSIYGLLV